MLSEVLIDFGTASGSAIQSNKKTRRYLNALPLLKIINFLYKFTTKKQFVKHVQSCIIKSI